jgi:formylglycine-generating enzyme required for sulfatase activity
MVCHICNESNPASLLVCRSCGAALNATVTASHAIPTGTKLQGGAFSIGRVLGQGGFGITYLGSDTYLKRPVAIKEFFLQGCVRQRASVQPSDAITTEDFQTAREGFLEEARRLARFQHPNICQVFQSFQENNTAYMVMEYLKGSTLHDELSRRGALAEAEAVSIICKIGEALEIVHQSNLLHRDIKPDNIMLVEGGRPVLVDFGAAREFAAGKTKRMTATLTPGYAPMEQYGRHARFGVYTDIYALGATLYHLLTGTAPIEAPDRMMGVELAPPSKVNPKVSQNVNDAVMWAMEVKVDERPQAIRDFLSVLTGKQSTPVPTPSSPNPTPGPTPSLPSTHSTSRINPIDRSEMVFIPAGEFIMGSEDDADERPVHKVVLGGYYIYKKPVTVAQYQKFCNDTGRSMPDPPTWGWKDEHPIVNVNWYDALVYVKWAGVRLPTEAEWEKAARGVNGWVYPWGNHFYQSCLWASRFADGDIGETAPVGSFWSGASTYGVLDMAGNVWEWCADWYNADYYQTLPSLNPLGPNSGKYRVLRGGSWSDVESDCFRAASRDGDYPDVMAGNVGFRCAADP